jgi:hypothetical protein
LFDIDDGFDGLGIGVGAGGVHGIDEAKRLE